MEMDYIAFEFPLRPIFIYLFIFLQFYVAEPAYVCGVATYSEKELKSIYKSE